MDRPFPAYQGNEPYVFVSYAREDSDVVYPELRWLKDQGFNIWYDEGISPGHEWRDELAAHIEESSLFLYFVTPRSAISEHCQREVNFAIDQKKQLLVVHLEETELPSGMGMSLSSLQAIMRYGLSDQEYRFKLLKGTSDHIQRGIAQVAEPPTKMTGIAPRVTAVVGLTGLLIVVAAFVTWNPDPAEPIAKQPTRRFEINLSTNEGPISGLDMVGQALEITADGSRIIFAGSRHNRKQLFVRSLSAIESVPIQGTEAASRTLPFRLSPDGEWVLVNESGTLKKVRLADGTRVTLHEMSGSVTLSEIFSYVVGMAWSSNDTIVFPNAPGPGLMQVSANGGTPESLTTPEQGIRHVSPYFLPDGNALLFAIHRDDIPTDTGQIALLSLESGEQRILLQGSSPQMAASGHLLYYRKDALWAAAFDSVKES